MVREGMAALLGKTKGLKVVVAAHDGDTAMLLEANPAVILLCAGLGDNDSLRVAESVKRDVPESKLILTDLLPVRDRKSTRLNSSHHAISRMPSSA